MAHYQLGRRWISLMVWAAAIVLTGLLHADAGKPIPMSMIGAFWWQPTDGKVSRNAIVAESSSRRAPGLKTHGWKTRSRRNLVVQRRGLFSSLTDCLPPSSLD